MIPYGRQDINQADIDGVVAVLQSDFLTQGPEAEQYHKEAISIPMFSAMSEIQQNYVVGSIKTVVV